MLVLSTLLLVLLSPSIKLTLASLLPASSPFLPREDSSNSTSFPSSVNLLEVGIYELKDFLANGTVTSVQLVEEYLKRIAKDNHAGLLLRAVIEPAPRESVLAIATRLDFERANGTTRGALHGIPLLLKDNIATDVELGMNTTAGSYALLGMPVPRDAAVSAKLRAAGAIIIGKSSLSEFANWKGNITNGWSARGGQTQSAYVAGGFSAGGDPCGSSSGSGVGVSAGFAAAALGSETDGSIICPSSRAALFGIKPTVGLVSRAGVVPISSTQDTTGPMGKSVYDIAAILETIAGVDERDNATTYSAPYILKNYTQFTQPQYTNLSSFRFGIPRKVFFPADEDALYNSTILDLSSKFGAFVQDPADFPSAEEFFAVDSETVVLATDFKVDLQTYLEGLGNATDGGPGVRSLVDLINFNDHSAALEMPEGECCQGTNILSVMTSGKSSAEYLQARANTFRLGATEGIDAVLDKYSLDALLLPAEDGATGPAAVVGYPIGTVPLGYYSPSGQPFGLAVLVRKWDEKTLISIMAGLEASLPPRKVPSQLV